MTRDRETGGAGESLLDADSVFDGVLRSSRDLRVDGEHHGEIHCAGRLTIAETARVFGDVHAETVALAGALDGDVDCTDRFELLPTARASARVLAGSVVIHPGALYEGELRMRQEPAGLAPREVTPAPIPWRARADADASAANERAE